MSTTIRQQIINRFPNQTIEFPETLDKPLWATCVTDYDADMIICCHMITRSQIIEFVNEVENYTIQHRWYRRDIGLSSVFCQFFEIIIDNNRRCRFDTFEEFLVDIRGRK